MLGACNLHMATASLLTPKLSGGLDLAKLTPKRLSDPVTQERSPHSFGSSNG
jgi:hypothetical protein